MGSFYKERDRLGVDVVEKQKYSAIGKEKQTRKSENKYNNINVHSLIFCDITSDKIEFNPNKAANQPFGIVHAVNAVVLKTEATEATPTRNQSCSIPHE